MGMVGMLALVGGLRNPSGGSEAHECTFSHVDKGAKTRRGGDEFDERCEVESGGGRGGWRERCVCVCACVCVRASDLWAVGGAGVPTRVVEQGPAQPLPQQLAVLPQLLGAQARPPPAALQQELQLPLPGGGEGRGGGERK